MSPRFQGCLSGTVTPPTPLGPPQKAACPLPWVHWGSPISSSTPSLGRQSLPGAGPQLLCGPAATRALPQPRSLLQAGPCPPHSRRLSQLPLAHQLSVPEHPTGCDLPGSCIVWGLSQRLPGAPGTVVTVGPLPYPSCTLDGTYPLSPFLLPGPLPPSLASPPAPGVSLGLLTRPCGITGRLGPPWRQPDLVCPARPPHWPEPTVPSPCAGPQYPERRSLRGHSGDPRGILREAGSAGGRQAAFPLEVELRPEG